MSDALGWMIAGGVWLLLAHHEDGTKTRAMYYILAVASYGLALATSIGDLLR